MRLAGTLLAVDVLISCLNVGIRRSNMSLAAWACIVLVRSDKWELCIRTMVNAYLENCIETRTPDYSPLERLEKLAHQSIPHLEKVGVSKDTPRIRRIVQDMLELVVRTPKSRCVADAFIAGLAAVAQSVPTVHEVLDKHDDIVKLWHTSWGVAGASAAGPTGPTAVVARATDCVKWATVLDSLLGLAPRMWKVLLGPRVKHPELVQCLWKFAHTVKVMGTPLADPRIALYHAIMLQIVDFPEEPLDSTVLSQTPAASSKTFDGLWCMPMDLEVRGMIDWTKWLTIVLDTTTGSGKGLNTIAGLRRVAPDIDDAHVEPDTIGITRVSPITHLYEVSNKIRPEASRGPIPKAFHASAKEFMIAIERGKTLNCLGQGAINAEPRKVVLALLKLMTDPKDPIVKHVNIDIEFTKPRTRARSATRSPRKKQRLQAGSFMITPAMPDLSVHNKYSALRPMAGMLNAHTETDARNGPVFLDGHAVSQCQMLSVPRDGCTIKSWICVYDNGTSVWIKSMPELVASYPLYLDRVKSLLGLPSMGAKWCDNWLIMHDIGHGGPYPTVVSGMKKWDIVDASKTGITVAKQPLDEIYDLLLFRSVFRVAWEPDCLIADARGIIYSTRENTVDSMHNSLWPTDIMRKFEGGPEWLQQMDAQHWCDRVDSMVAVLMDKKNEGAYFISAVRYARSVCVEASSRLKADIVAALPD